MKFKDNISLTKYSPAEELRNEKFIAQALWECLKDNDTESFMEILEAHLKASNILKISTEKDIARSTIYNALKHGNPTLRTLGKLVHSFSEKNCSKNEEEAHCIV